MTTLQLAFSGPDEVVLSGAEDLPEHEQVWLWDLLYAATLHECDGEAGVAEWQEERATWAVNTVGRVFMGRDAIESEGGVGYSDVVVRAVDAETIAALAQDPVALEIVPMDEALPGLRARWPDGLATAQRMRLVDALAQYFINDNTLFLRELPLHIMAMQKFYQEQKGSEDPASVSEAPIFALTKALEYFEARRRDLAEPVAFMDSASGLSS